MSVIGRAIGIPFLKRTIDQQALAHYNKVIADGGIIPISLVELSNLVKLIKVCYGVTDIALALSVGIDPHYFGYKSGAGSGTTLGMAVQRLYSITGTSSDFTQTTALSQPLLLFHSKTNYYFSPRVVGNYCSSPYNASITLRGSFDIKAEIQTNLSGTQQDIFTSNASGNLKLTFRTNSSNGLRLILYLDGATALIYDSTVNIATITNRTWVRVTRNSTTGIIQFFTSSDGTTWNQLGANVSGATGNLFNGTNPYEVGSSLQGASVNSFQGIIYRVLVSQAIDGAAVLDFNPAMYNASVSQNTFTSTTSEMWTMFTDLTATNGYKGRLVDRTMTQFDGINDSMLSSFTGGSAITDYLVFNQLGWVNADYIYDGPTTGAAALQMISATPNLRYEGLTSSFNTSAFTLGVLSLYTFSVSTSASSGIMYLNNTQVTTGGSYSEPNGIRLGARFDGGAQNGNFSFRTMFRAKQIDSSTNRTGMYSIIKSMNNNAF